MSEEKKTESKPTLMSGVDLKTVAIIIALILGGGSSVSSLAGGLAGPTPNAPVVIMSESDKTALDACKGDVSLIQADLARMKEDLSSMAQDQKDARSAMKHEISELRDLLLRIVASDRKIERRRLEEGVR